MQQFKIGIPYNIIRIPAELNTKIHFNFIAYPQYELNNTHVKIYENI